jgi:hypothetical protein
MPLAVMEALGMSCTKYYETGESIYAIDSRKVPAYGEIKDFYAWITTAPHIITVFNIIVVDLPPSIWSCAGKRLDIYDQRIYNERWKLYDATRKRRSND